VKSSNRVDPSSAGGKPMVSQKEEIIKYIETVIDPKKIYELYVERKIQICFHFPNQILAVRPCDPTIKIVYKDNGIEVENKLRLVFIQQYLFAENLSNTNTPDPLLIFYVITIDNIYSMFFKSAGNSVEGKPTVYKFSLK
jgi:hypothetical protein